jgi:hypothetical protein
MSAQAAIAAQHVWPSARQCMMGCKPWQYSMQPGTERIKFVSFHVESMHQVAAECPSAQNTTRGLTHKGLCSLVGIDLKRLAISPLRVVFEELIHVLYNSDLHGALLHAPLLFCCCLGQVMVRLLMWGSIRSCKTVSDGDIT